MADGFRIQMFYPVDGDSAIAELFDGESQWAAVWLEDIELNAVGEARVEDARVVVGFCEHPPAPGRSGVARGLDYASVRAQLDQARDALLENERGREPGSDDGLTNAGRAASKISPAKKRWWLQK